MSNSGDVELVCPSCGENLPPVRLVMRTEKVHDGLTITIHPRLDGAWQQALCDTHPECVLRRTG